MRWLLWKDYRHNRLIVFTALFFLLAPHLFMMYIICGGPFPGLAAERERAEQSREPPSIKWRNGFAGSSAASLIMSQLAVVLIGGNMIAGERVDRSSEFLFSLPIARRRILASKILLALAINAVIWMNALVIWCVTDELRLGPENASPMLLMLANIAITGLVFFCVAWMLSACTASPAFAVLGGLVTPLLVMGGFYYVAYLLGVPLDLAAMHVEPWYRAICLTLAPPFFAVGTWYYLRRVEP